MMNQTFLKFNTSNRAFYAELRKRVDIFFKENSIDKTGNLHLYFKAIFMLSMYFVPYLLIVLGIVENKFIFWSLSFIMGLAMAGIGMSVMHDAAHGAFSKNKTVNNTLSFTLNLLGGHYLNWKIQHNIIHHTFTNVHNHDEDIQVPFFLRFEPHSKLKFIHRFQFIYAWFFYCFLTLNWVFIKDFNQIIRYHKMGHLKTSGTSLKKQFFIIILSKIGYLSYMLLPYFLTKNLTFVEWLVGFLTLHFTAGFILSVIFQLAHVVTDTSFPVPDLESKMENDWAAHQLHTTMNFGTRSKILTWLTGGLNHQVEHHLFPAISHVHYFKISPIVKQTAMEFNLPYLEKKSIFNAFTSHVRMLYHFGRS